jgi:hypothetical protein
MKEYKYNLFFPLLYLMTIFSLSFGENGYNKVYPVKIKKVALFKNGLGYFVSESELPKNAKSIEFGQLPIPTLGSFWVDYPKTLKVRSLNTSMKPQDETVPIQSITDLLQANIGKRATITTNLKDNATFTGII